jgi:uncharacterized membrane protein YraQ (UPF0718 family)
MRVRVGALEGRHLLTASILIAFILAVIAGLIYSRIATYSLTSTITVEELHGLPIWYIPITYLIDYLSHGWICLLFAFVAAGLIYELVPKSVITNYMRRGRVTGYILALVAAPLLTACSCTMVPLFAGVLYSGAGIGPAITFLLTAPSANILAILLTGDMLYWELAWVRVAVSVAVALLAGIIVSITPWGRRVEEEVHRSGWSCDVAVSEVSPPLDEKLLSALKFGGYLAKQILPYFIIGLIAVSYVEAFLPSDIVGSYLTGFSGVLMASVIGGPLYTPTLVEVVVGKGLWSLGMSKGALLAWLMDQPYEVANALAVSRITRWKVVATYMVIAWAGSVAFGTLYGILSGSL